MIVFDTDPGVDDVVAIFYAVKIGLLPVGITTVHGNRSIDNVTNNALYLRNQLFNSSIVVYKGCAESLDGKTYSAISSGKTGLGNLKIPSIPLDTDISAVDYLAETLKSNDKTDIFALGPLTNLAVLFNYYPDTISKIGTLYVMGGVFGQRGNISEHAEFNVFCDPAAFKAVMKACYENKVDTVVIPADVCRKVVLNKVDLAVLQQAAHDFNVTKIVEPYLDYYLTNKEYGGFSGAVIYDLLIPLYYRYPHWFKSENVRINVVIDQNAEHGLTTYVADENSTIKLVRYVDADEVKSQFLQDIAS